MKEKFNLRPRRVFSEALKRKVVDDIEKGKATVLAVCREYDVSDQCVYAWLKKYSRHLQSSKVMVVQMESESYKTEHGYKMKAVYEVAGISKQALHQNRARALRKCCQQKEFFEQADAIRHEHPKAGCRKMALDMVCRGWGRDRIEGLLLSNGYRVYYPPNYTRTTSAQHELYFPNLIEGLELNNINQLVQTDITYYRVGNR